MGRPPAFTRDQMLDTARSLFGTRGFEGTTLDDIARELNVTPAAVLRHVSSKQQLFIEAMTATHQELAAAVMMLDTVPGETDPALVLRQLATNLIPFLERRVNELVVVALHLRSRGFIKNPVEGLPVGPESPPARALAALERYFRRGKRAGTVTMADPKAAALLFLGSIQSYVFFHQVLKVSTPPYPPEKFVDSLIELWRGGAISGAPAAARRGGRRGSSK